MARAIPDSRIGVLDGLRGVAALAVVLYHYFFRSAEFYPELGDPVRWFWPGQYGVQLFFIISGFVIYLTLERSTLRSFAVSRFIRLYPIYWVCVALTGACVALFGLSGRETTFLEWLANLTMFQRYFGVAQVDGAYWTLAAELGFYVQVAFLFYAGLLRCQRSIVYLYVWVFGTFAIVYSSRFLPFEVYASGIRALAPGLVWMPLFVMGVAFFKIWDGDHRLLTLSLPAVSLMLLAPHGPTVLLATLTVGAVFVVVMWTPLGEPLTKRPLVFLGEISYVLYLVHQNLGYIVILKLSELGMSHWTAALVALLGIIPLAAMLTYVVDVPLRRILKRMWLSSRKATV
ncbi:acyltransferase [Terrabacter sp. Root85]|uniref:acyltransferase family protein n=1 Tax=Terrabacter sp. Root85 TaxID=1736603 RepID=UPI00138F0396|nr:acyltransferase [Terrabacter sp. Root85]